ncbi:type II toxin-antitoxin system RelE/ParE family toxin [bacterium]|nr:type II toxin-antitoxin system RelE/ParE family toxin [bacterium]
MKKYQIEFWQDENGYSDTQEYIIELKEKASKSKDARIKLNKIVEYIELLSAYGVEIGQPYVKHIKENNVQLYELRPLRDRFFFFFKKENRYIILNHFIKKTQKTPKKEIEKAIKLIKDFNERGL